MTIRFNVSTDINLGALIVYEAESNHELRSLIIYEHCGHWSCGCCDYAYRCRGCNIAAKEKPKDVIDLYHVEGLVEEGCI